MKKKPVDEGIQDSLQAQRKFDKRERERLEKVGKLTRDKWPVIVQFINRDGREMTQQVDPDKTVFDLMQSGSKIIIPFQ